MPVVTEGYTIFRSGGLNYDKLFVKPNTKKIGG